MGNVSMGSDGGQIFPGTNISDYSYKTTIVDGGMAKHYGSGRSVCFVYYSKTSNRIL